MTTPQMIRKVRRLAEIVEEVKDVQPENVDSFAVRRLRSIAREHGDAQHVGWVFTLYAPNVSRRIVESAR